MAYTDTQPNDHFHLISALHRHYLYSVNISRLPVLSFISKRTYPTLYGHGTKKNASMMTTMTTMKLTILHANLELSVGLKIFIFHLILTLIFWGNLSDRTKHAHKTCLAYVLSHRTHRVNSLQNDAVCTNSLLSSTQCISHT